MAITQLNLPDFNFQVATDAATGAPTIYDRLRRKHVALTPEEWVRQHFVEYLINCKGYPAGFMANEVSLRLNGTQRRSDTVVFDARRRPVAIVEYKAPEVEITQRVFDQIARYNVVLQARLLIVSNGLRHYCCAYRGDGTYAFLRDVPSFSELNALAQGPTP